VESYVKDKASVVQDLDTKTYDLGIVGFRSWVSEALLVKPYVLEQA
jgi:hypothetical protein